MFCRAVAFSKALNQFISLLGYVIISLSNLSPSAPYLRRGCGTAADRIQVLYFREAIVHAAEGYAGNR
jgi:hypothetical protein